jgi:hypothetical protein
MLKRPISPIVLVAFLAVVALGYTVFVFNDPATGLPTRAFNTIAGGSTSDSDLQELIVSVGQSSLPNVQDNSERKLAPLEKITGEAKVHADGTLEILGTRIRLEGLVLPTKADAAIDTLKDFARQSDVHCALLTREVAEVRDATCWVMSAGHPIDIVAELLLAGLGRECLKTSLGRYHVFEQMSASEIPLPPECGGETPVVAASGGEQAAQ